MTAVLEPPEVLQDVLPERHVYTAEELAEKAERYRGELTQLAQNHTGDYGLAQDAVQEAVIYLCRRASEFDPEQASLRTVLGRVTCWFAANILDAELVRHPPDVLPGFNDAEEQELVLNHDGTLDYLRRAQRKKYPSDTEREAESAYSPAYDIQITVRQALARLPEDLRSVAVAVLMHGETQEEYGARIGRDRFYVARLLDRAKASLVSDLS